MTWGGIPTAPSLFMRLSATPSIHTLIDKEVRCRMQHLTRRPRNVFSMQMLIIHAVIACVSMLTPRRCEALIQRTLTDISVARTDVRWVAMVGKTQVEPLKY